MNQCKPLSDAQNVKQRLAVLCFSHELQIDGVVQADDAAMLFDRLADAFQ